MGQYWNLIYFQNMNFPTGWALRDIAQGRDAASLDWAEVGSVSPGSDARCAGTDAVGSLTALCREKSPQACSRREGGSGLQGRAEPKPIRFPGVDLNCRPSGYEPEACEAGTRGAVKNCVRRRLHGVSRVLLSSVFERLRCVPSTASHAGGRGFESPTVHSEAVRPFVTNECLLFFVGKTHWVKGRGVADRLACFSGL